MSQYKYFQKNIDGDSPALSIPATTALNQEYVEYLDMAGESGYDSGSLQIEWTAGAGGGTLDLKLYGTLQDDGTAAASCAYQDITTALFGVASITGDAMTLDGDNVMGNVKFIKISATIANKDASTALTVYARLKKNN